MFCNTRDAVRHLQAVLLERGFSVVALSGELTQNERTMALQALRDGRARVCVATDVAARGIDLPSLDLVIHADLPNDPEVLQHRSGRTGRAGRKGVSILLVPPARKRRAETLLNLAGIDAVWGIAPQPDEIRKLDQERMLKDDLFAAETTAEDLAIAQALLAERSAEDIAAALARLYRARLPSPEDIGDPGEGRVKSRAERAQERVGRESGPRNFDRDDGPRKPKKSLRDGMPEGSVWFRAAIGRRKNAEARWLLPMICRRGGITKGDIGAIKIMDTTTEFEISQRVAESFATMIKRPDKEDTIRIEALEGAPQREAAPEKRSFAPRREAPRHEAPRHEAPRHDTRAAERAPAANEFARDERPSKQHGKPYKPHDEKPRGENPPSFDRKPDFKSKKRHQDKPAFAGNSRRDRGPDAKPAFAKKPKKKFRG